MEADGLDRGVFFLRPWLPRYAAAVVRAAASLGVPCLNVWKRMQDVSPMHVRSAHIAPLDDYFPE